MVEILFCVGIPLVIWAYVIWDDYRNPSPDW